MKRKLYCKVNQGLTFSHSISINQSVNHFINMSELLAGHNWQTNRQGTLNIIDSNKSSYSLVSPYLSQCIYVLTCIHPHSAGWCKGMHQCDTLL